MAVKELVLEHGDVVAAVAPERGAIITRLKVRGREILAMDRATLEDPSKSVRGGIPLLFPFAGRLDGDRLVHAGSQMKQHGFARNRAWSIVDERPGLLRLRLEDDEESRAAYPHRLRLEQTVTLLPRGLHVELLMWNRGDAPMPVSPGWHPYFACPSSEKPRVKPLHGEVDPARFTPDAEFDFGVTAPVDGRTAFEIPSTGRVEMAFSPEMRFLQCWGLPGKDFICLEPFFGPNNTINTERRLDIPAGTARTLWMRVDVL